MRHLFLILFLFVFSSMNAQILEDDFEDGTFDAWTGTLEPNAGYLDIDGTYAKSGSYGMAAGANGSMQQYNYAYPYYDFSSKSEVWMRCWFYIEDATTITTYPMASNTRGNIMAAYYSSNWTRCLTTINVWKNSGGTLYMSAFMGSTKMGSDVAISVQTWYELKLKGKLNGSSDEGQWWIDGTSQGSVSGNYISDPTYTYDEFFVGFYPNTYATHEAEFWFDDAGIFESDPGSFSSGWEHDFNGVSNSSISEINGVSKSSISNIIDQ